MLIATTNNQLTLLEFPRGNIVQKYVGCDAVETTSCEVDQLSALDVQRYGMRPGECGAYRVQLQKNESAEAYHKRRREAQKDVLPKKIVAKFIIGFLGPITSWYEQQTGTFYFGTTDGKVGAFDIGTDIKSSTVLCSSNDRPIRLQFLVSVHAGVVMGMFYSSYAASLFTAGMDGRIYRISIAYSGEPVGDPRPIGHQMRAIRCMKWVPPSKHFITIHVNRRVVVWVIGRNSEPLWCFPPEAQEVLSASLHPRQHRLAVLLSDKTIKVYETHGKKSIATIQQTSTDTTRGVADPMRETAPLSEGDDGVVMWHPYSTSLICALRTVVIYTPSRARDASSCDELPPQSTATPETGLTENKTSDGAADAVSGGYDTRETLASLGPRRADTHQSGIVATLVHKHSWLLHTFSENAWRVWDLETGALRQHVDVPSTVRMGNLSLQTASVASCSWSTTTQTRLVTGGQDCSVITWDPETHAPLEHECLVRDTSDQLDFDVSVISHQNYLIAWTARTCRVTRYSSGILLPNGVESSDSTVIRVPSLSSVTACCVARDVYLCIGTGDSVLYFYSIRGGSPLHESLLVGPHGDEKGAIIQLIYLNEQEQSLLLAVLDNGLLFTYAVVDRSVLGCARLFHRFECRIRKALYVPDVALLLCGDSKGRLTAYTLLGHNPVQIDVRHPPPQCFSILAASSEITSLDAFTRTYGKYVIVGSLDRQVRLFRLEDITCGGSHSTVSPPFSALTTPRATIGDTVTFVGRFGRDIWRLDDPSTYNNDKAILAETKDVNSSAVEALLEGIIRPHAGATGARLDASLCTEEESGGSFAKFRKGRRVSTPSICPVPAQAAQQSSSFFLTEPSMMQMDGNQNVNMSMSCGSTKYPHDVPMPQHSPLQQPTTETSETNRASLSQQSERAWTVTSSRQRRSSTKVFTVSPTSQISGSSNQATAGTFMQNPEEVSDSVPRRESASGEGYRLRARSFLVSMTTRLEKVRPEGYRKGAFEMRLSEVSSSIEVPDGDHHSSDAMRLVLETRARLAERMEEYRRRQEALNKKRKTSGMQILARAILPPVVIPQPNVRSVDAHPSNDVTAAALRKQVTWRF
uniref:Uncharacterized protein n=1 Tax=Trypanosoma vivax (strain Y486) TaxID=1055687 RepID=G0TZK6_TRYVY|nr:conserved hypothetical protein [Trypanosoma vivax Y486]